VNAKEITQQVETAIEEHWSQPENPECPITEYDIIERIIGEHLDQRTGRIHELNAALDISRASEMQTKERLSSVSEQLIGANQEISRLRDELTFAQAIPDVPGPDPVFQGRGAWFYFEENWADSRGPFESEKAARDSLKLYGEYLDGQRNKAPLLWEGTNVPRNLPPPIPAHRAIHGVTDHVEWGNER